MISAGSPDYIVNTDIDAAWDLFDVHSGSQPLRYAMLETNVIEIQDACYHVKAAVPSALVDYAGFPHVRVANTSPGSSTIVSYPL